MFLSAQNESQGPNLRRRVLWCAAVFLGLFGLVAARLIQIAALPAEARAAAYNAPSQKPRPNIVDRNGVLLATDLTVASVFVDGRVVWDAKETAEALSSIFPEINAGELEAKLAAKPPFLFIKRDITPREHAAVHALGLPGIGFMDELKRIYPNGRAAAHVLGYVGVDHVGLAGMERAIDLGRATPAAPGEPVVLSLDHRIQHVVADELADAMAVFKAIAAIGVVLDVRSGEVIAMASLPDFDPNRLEVDPEENRFNRAALGVYEMGSTFKAFNTAMALEYCGIKVDDKFDAREPLRFGRFTIDDFHAKRKVMTVAEVFEHSSNIGSARMAMKCGAERQKAFLKALGQLDPEPIELPERGAPLLPPRWGDIEVATISYGHGIAVSPMHVVSGIAALANGGQVVHPTLLKRAPRSPAAPERLISAETSRRMNELMRLVVERGTAKRADVPGYPVGGKTGTAEKSKAGGYARTARLSSFIGVFPADAPEYAIFVLLDEPQGTAETHGFATGGWTAAPTVAKIVARIAPLLGVTPRAIPPAEASADVTPVSGDDAERAVRDQ